MFKARPYDPDREDTRTDAQKTAGERNFRIFKLRGLQAQMFMLTGPRRELAQALVDQELIAMGAKAMVEASRDRSERAMRKTLKNTGPFKRPDCGLIACDCIPF